MLITGVGVGGICDDASSVSGDDAGGGRVIPLDWSYCATPGSSLTCCDRGPDAVKSGDLQTGTIVPSLDLLRLGERK